MLQFRLQSSMDKNEQIELIEFITLNEDDDSLTEEEFKLYLMRVTISSYDNDELIVSIYDHCIKLPIVGYYLKEIRRGNRFALEEINENIFLHLFLAKYARRMVLYDGISVLLEKVFPTPFNFSTRILENFDELSFLKDVNKPHNV